MRCDFTGEVLDFSRMADVPAVERRWFTVTSPDVIEGVELVLEPVSFKPAIVYQKALFDAGIPKFVTKDIHSDGYVVAGGVRDFSRKIWNRFHI